MLNELIQLVAFAVAALLHGITGMGFPMISTTALSLMLPLSTAVALTIVPSVLMSVLVLTTQKNPQYAHHLTELQFYLKNHYLLILGSIVGSVIGVKLLFLLPVAWLYLLMSVVTLYYVIYGYCSLKAWVKPFTVPTNRVSMLCFGLLAGVIGGSTNAMSPILLMFLFSYTQNNHEIAKVSNICYLSSKLVQLLYLSHQLFTFTSKEIYLLILLTIISILFLLVGIKMRSFISPNLFKQIICLILLILAVKVGYSGMNMI